MHSLSAFRKDKWPKLWCQGFWTIVLAAQYCEARIYMKKTSIVYNRPNEASYQLLTRQDQGFGFLTGGNLHFSMTCPTPEPLGFPDMWLLMCDSAEAREFTRFTPNTLRMDCHTMRRQGGMSHKGVCWRHMVRPNSTSMSGYHFFAGRVQQKFHTVFMLLQCPNGDLHPGPPRPTSCQSELLLQNPEGVHLSSDEIPLPLMYTVLCIIWACVLGIWFFNAFLYYRFSNRLHKMLTWMPMCKALVVVMVMLRWEEVASAGMETSNLWALGHVLASVEDGLLFLVLMVASEGYCVLHVSMRNTRWATVIVLFLIFNVAMLCVFWVHKYFLAFSVCCVVFVLYKTLKWTSHNVTLLHKRRRKMLRFIHRLNMCYQSEATIEDLLFQKENLFRQLRILGSTFCITYAIAVTLATFLQDFAYLRALAFEVPELIVFICLGYIFRLRNFQEYEKVKLYPPTDVFVIVENPDVCEDTTANNYMIGRPLSLVRSENEVGDCKTSLLKPGSSDVS